MKARPTNGDVLGSPRLALVAGGLLVGIGLAMLPGCGPAGVELAPAEGIVTLDGQPVEGAGVTFQPQAGGPAASGTTDAEGRFQLRTMNQPGAPLGKHIVLISKTDMDLPRLADGKVDEAKLREMTDLEEKNLLPAKYSSPATSELRAIIDTNGERTLFSLISDETVADTTDADESADTSEVESIAPAPQAGPAVGETSAETKE